MVNSRVKTAEDFIKLWANVTIEAVSQCNTQLSFSHMPALTNETLCYGLDFEG